MAVILFLLASSLLASGLLASGLLASKEWGVLIASRRRGGNGERSAGKAGQRRGAVVVA